MKWIKTILLWIVTGGIIWSLYMFGIRDFDRLGDQYGPNPFRPLFRIALAWVIGGIVFVVAVFITRKTMEE
jgi:hypothetical protein